MMMALAGGQGAEEAVRFFGGAGGEEEGVGGAGGCAVAESESPQAVDLDRVGVGAGKEAHELALVVEGADFSVAEVSDQDVVAEQAEVVRGLHGAPRGIEAAARGEASHERAVGVEDIDESVARAGYVVVGGAVLQRVGDVKLVADIGDV